MKNYLDNAIMVIAIANIIRKTIDTIIAVSCFAKNPNGFGVVVVVVFFLLVVVVVAIYIYIYYNI